MMFSKAKTWHGGLSKTGKIIFWVVTTVVASSAINAAAGPTSTQTSKSPEVVQTAEVKAKEITKKFTTETAPVIFSKTTIDDAGLAKGTSEIRVVGVNGIKTLSYEIAYEERKEISKRLIKEEITTAPITEVTALGSYEAPARPSPNSFCDPNYTPCVPNVSYDLDCPDIGFRVTIIGYDPHGFDGRDNDGIGCESY
jgi:resuscitation-promoting factor RpfB